MKMDRWLRNHCGGSCDSVDAGGAVPVCPPDFNGTPDIPMFQPESSEHAHNKAIVLIARMHMTILYATFIDLRVTSPKSCTTEMSKGNSRVLVAQIKFRLFLG
jgi:hypothetical protein